jgi:hypothetical protein
MNEHNLKLLGIVALFFSLASFGLSRSEPAELSAKVSTFANSNCATIQSGTIRDTGGNVLKSGYDKYGYNYQAHMFNGTYDGSDRNLDGTYWGSTGEFVDDKLIMKWSDEWLASVDCNGDGLLDRGLVNGVVGGVSLGWLTNNISGDYTNLQGGTSHYTDFVKIVWTGPGSPLWGQYSIIQEVLNDPAGGFHGLLFKEYGAPGFGLNDHWTTE